MLSELNKVAQSRFRSYESVFEPEELTVFQGAYEDACRKLGLDPSPADPEEWRSVRNALANAVVNAAKFGERDLAALSAFAVAFGMRNWHLSKR